MKQNKPKREIPGEICMVETERAKLMADRTLQIHK